MKKLCLFPAVLIALACTSTAQARNDAGDVAARSKVKPVRLVSFDGERELLKTSSRLRVWRGELGFVLSVDAAGMPTDCELTEKFRMTYVNNKLCQVLIEHHTFEPALDASGAPVESSYAARLNFMEMREKE